MSPFHLNQMFLLPLLQMLVLSVTLEFYDASNNQIATATITQKSGTTDGTQWEEGLRFLNASGLNLEADLGYKLSVYDPYGNYRVIGFDAQNATETGQTTSAPSQKLRIDTKDSSIIAVEMVSDNSGTTDPLRPHHLITNKVII